GMQMQGEKTLSLSLQDRSDCSSAVNKLMQPPRFNSGVADALIAFCRQIKKVPVLCKDAPGFIVNRVARHYYLEAMAIASRQSVSIEDIDAALEAVGFKMGPFKLMDMIGMDVNLAVSTSLYEAFDHNERFRPSPMQIEKVANKELGRKTGKGFYNYNL
ncbi:MAG: hypothetical protein EOP49_28335, partial [Sphingobacteriales bacterium]